MKEVFLNGYYCLLMLMEFRIISYYKMEKKLNCVLLIDDDFVINFINKKIV